MNPPASDDPLHQPRSRRQLSASQYRALRKELLILRSDVERLEFAQAGAELRQTITHFRWLKLLVPDFSDRSFGKSVKGLNAGMSALVGRYPLLSSLVSALLAKRVRALITKSTGPTIKWGAVGFTIWEVYQIWKGAQRDKATANVGTSRANHGE